MALKDITAASNLKILIQRITPRMTSVSTPSQIQPLIKVATKSDSTSNSSSYSPESVILLRLSHSSLLDLQFDNERDSIEEQLQSININSSNVKLMLPYAPI